MEKKPTQADEMGSVKLNLFFEGANFVHCLHC